MDGARMLGLGLLALAVCAGCQRPVPLHAVSGKVYYRGALLSNVDGVVVFTPDASHGESGPSAYGKLRPDGSYVLTTNDAVGAAPGWYRVTVAAFAATPPADPRRFQAPELLLPKHYCDPELSLLRCEVKANQTNTINLNLD